MKKLFYFFIFFIAQGVFGATGPVQFSVDAAYQFHNDNATYANLFDGDFTTRWDTSAASNGYVGINTLSQTILTSIRIGSRVGETDCIAGIQVQGGDSASGPWTTLKTLPSYPPYYFAKRFTDIPISTTQTYQYYRILSAIGTYGNATELRFIGLPGASTIYKPVTPTITPAGGRFATSKQVTITSETTDATLFYTTDNSTPTLLGGVPQGTTQQYSGPIIISTSGTTVIRAISYVDSVASEVSEAAHITIDQEILPGAEWYDSQGHYIESHLGSVQYFGGKYYWYGSNFNEALPELRKVGITVYSSTDTINWDYEGLAYYDTTISTEQARVIYNDTTGQYVMWIGNTTTTAYPAIVATSSTPVGPFTAVTTTKTVDGASKVLHPSLFKDDDGNAYLLYDTGANSVRISKLTSDYLDTTGTDYIQPFSTAINVNPYMFKRNGVYFLMTSSLPAGWGTSLTKYSTATTPLGTWSALQNPFQVSGEQSNTTSYNSQGSNVFRIIGRSDAYVYMGDRYDNSNINGGSLYNSRHVWLPITFPTTTTMSISWSSAWTINGAFPTPADLTNPTVSIISPADQSTVSSTLSVVANAADNVGVASVVFKIDGTVFSTITTAPFTATLDTTLYVNGNHTVTTVATDAAGNFSSTATITVNIANTLPEGEVQFGNDVSHIFGNANGGDGGNYTNVFDNNLDTFWASVYPTGGYVGIDTGTPTEVTGMLIGARRGNTVRPYGMTLQGADSPLEAATWTTVYTIPTWPSGPYLKQRQFNKIDFDTSGAKYRYYRLVAAPNQYGNIAELRLIGKADRVANYKPAIPTINPGGGYYDVPIVVSLASETTSASLFYTLDGSTPVVTNGIPQGTTHTYAEPFTLPVNGSTVTIKAISVLENKVSEVSDSAIFTMKTTYRSGQDWYDTSSKFIESHSGDIRFFNGKWYWYGQIQNTNDPEFESVGISVYSSTDFINWKDEGAAFYIGRNLHGAEYKLERAHVIYNSTTHKYVMWAHNNFTIVPNSASQAFIATADNPEGPFTIINASYNPQGLGLNDMTVFQDLNGDAYLLNSTASDNNGHFYISKLSSDYLTVVQSINPTVLNGREAPTIFYRDGLYYILTSGLLGWLPNKNEYSTSTSMLGTWSALQNPFQVDGVENYLTAYTSQTAYIQKIPGRTDAFVYFGDRFDTSDPYGGSLYNSRHVILPISFGVNGIMSISWDSEWDMDEYFSTSSAPSSATGLSVSPSGNHINISWVNQEMNGKTLYLDRADNENFTTGFRSYLLPENSTTFTDTYINPDNDYFYRVRTVNADGVSLSSTVGSADTIPPALSLISVGATSQTTASGTWTTDEAASSEIEYGFTSGYGSSVSSATLETSHSLSLVGLLAGTTYHYRIVSTDAAGNTARSDDATFVTPDVPDTTPPTATVGYSTTAPTNGNVVATITPSESITVINNSGLFTKTFTTNGSFQFDFIDGAGNTGSVTATVGNIDKSAPIFSLINVAATSQTTASGTWTTDEAASSEIEYGLTSGYGSSVSSATLETSHSLSLIGLLASTTYHYRIVSTDAAGNTARSDDVTFVTPDDPTISSGSGGGGYRSRREVISIKPSEVIVLQESKLSPIFMRDLKSGISGKDVVILQKFLIKKNVGEASLELKKIGANGFFGAETKAALIEYQKSISMSPTGYLKIKRVVKEKEPNQSIKEEMNSIQKQVYSFQRDLSIGSEGEDVRSLQIYLNTGGYVVASSGPGSPGNETTRFGRATQAALIRFQINKNITPAVGYFGPITRERIIRE